MDNVIDFENKYDHDIDKDNGSANCESDDGDDGDDGDDDDDGDDGDDQCR